MKQKLIFIGGTGRSGTHLVGRTIASNSQVTGRIEVNDTFALTNIATRQDLNSWFKNAYLKGRLILRLKKILKTSDKYILEKSHPSIWITDEMLTFLPQSKFIFVYRDLEPTVSSMLEHKSVLSWFDVLPQDKINRFLGINKNNVKVYSDYSIEEKCALRWQSHFNEIQKLHSKYPKSTYLLKYDDFLINPEPFLKEISAFLEIPDVFNPEKFKIDSLDKWKTKLTDEQLNKIRNIVA